jgi:hypothetical protein
VVERCSRPSFGSAASAQYSPWLVYARIIKTKSLG